MTDSEAAAWTRGHAVGARELKAAEQRWQVERAELRAEVERLRADAERYRFVRDADRSDCITRELSLYAMESLDEYVDAAMEAAARAALKEAK